MDLEKQTTETQYIDGGNAKPLKKSRYELNYTGLSILSIMVITIFALFFTLTIKESKDIAQAEKLKAEVIKNTETKINPFDSVSLTGNAAFVWDSSKQEKIFGYNEEAQLPLASLTKLMTILTASDVLDPDNIIVIESDSLETEGDSGLIIYEQWSFKNLSDFTLVVSSNDGAAAIASTAGAIQLHKSYHQNQTEEAAFVEAMNIQSKKIGLEQTYFVNETGLDPNEALSGGYGSVKDVAILLDKILEINPSLVEATAFEAFSINSNSMTHTATNTNQIVGKITGLIASKTGFTDLAGGNLVIAFDVGINRPIIAAVLGSTKEGRFEDIEKLVKATILYISQ